MSWSVEATGTKAAVRAKVDAELTKQAANYAGKEEEKDVLAARDRALAAIDSLAEDPTINGVRVSANGSASSYSMGMRVEVTRVSLAL